VAERQLGAYIERFQGFLAVPATLMRAQRISSLHVPRIFRLADCTSSLAHAWGITAEIHSSRDRLLSQSWASAFHQAGFDGVRYLARNDPSQRLVCLALFGATGEASWPVAGTSRISRRLVETASIQFGIHVI